MASNRNGPALWDALLDAVNVPGAVVAGGSIRDWCLGIDPKDIDIFVPCKDLDAWIDFKYNLLGSTSLHDILDTQEGKEYERTDFSRDANPLYGVLEGEMLGVTVNLIANALLLANPDTVHVQPCPKVINKLGTLGKDSLHIDFQ